MMYNFMSSPATPTAILLYGIAFGFAMWTYLGLEWQRNHTIALYLSTAVWAIVVIVRRWRAVDFSINRLDIFLCAFLLLVLGSAAAHWWEGTINYLKFIPFFMIIPYLLGRTMNAQDAHLFRTILVGMGGVLLLLMPLEYWRNSQPGFLYVNSPAPILFGQSHGVMLTGLMFSAAILALVSFLFLPKVSNTGSRGYEKWVRLIGYLMLAAMASAMVWISSRGSGVATVMGMIALFLFSSFLGWKKKIAILFYIGLFTLVAFMFLFQNKYHKEYYQQLFQRPIVTQNEVPRQVAPLEYGKPILGESICKDIPNSISDRWIHYRSAWEMFLAKPLTGVGANAYGFYSCTGPGWFPHTTVLQVLAELGVLGGLLYFSLIWSVFRVPFTKVRSDVDVLAKANMSWFLSFIILQFTTSQFYSNYFMSAGLYFAVGLAASFHDGVKSKLVEA